MKDLILIGGGGHCKSCIDVIEAQGNYRIAGILDVKEKINESVLGYKIIGCDDDIPELAKDYNDYLITVGQIKTAELRVKLFNKLKQLNLKLPVIISPNAYVSKHSEIDEGTIIMHHVLVNASAKIGKNCIINSKALLEHDSVIGNHCHISTGAVINGGVKIGDCSFIGSSAVTKEYITVDEYGFVKANSIVK